MERGKWKERDTGRDRCTVRLTHEQIQAHKLKERYIMGTPLPPNTFRRY